MMDLTVNQEELMWIAEKQRMVSESRHVHIVLSWP